MDLKKEILTVLDNPTNMWESVLNNFPDETRVTLMVFTTCKPQLDIVDWQAAVARVSLDAATKFEEALRVLDDVFVRTNRPRTTGNKYLATYRNPSMDDFCADHLDRNASFAIRVASHTPTLSQVERLIELGTARTTTGTGEPAYSNLHSSLVLDPTTLVTRLLELLPTTSMPTPAFFNATLPLVRLISAGDPDRVGDDKAIRARLKPALMNSSFSGVQGAPYALFDDLSVAKRLPWVLKDDFGTFYENVAASASTFEEFDCLVNLDVAVGRTGADASWADNFQAMSRSALDDENFDTEQVTSSKGFYSKVAEHLDLDEHSHLQDWEDLSAEMERKQPDDEVEDRGDDWREETTVDRQEASSLLASITQENATIDALFVSLTTAEPR